MKTLDHFQPRPWYSAPPPGSLLSSSWPSGRHPTCNPTGRQEHSCILPPSGGKWQLPPVTATSLALFPGRPLATALPRILPRQDIHTRPRDSWTHGVTGTPGQFPNHLSEAPPTQPEVSTKCRGEKESEWGAHSPPSFPEEKPSPNPQFLHV